MRLIKGIYKFFDRKIILPITRLFVGIGKKLKITGKPFEAILKTKSSLIIISLLFALFAFWFVDNVKGVSIRENDAEVIYNTPVETIFNNEEYVVEGVPETVDITLIGSKANLYLAKQLPNRNVNVDLKNLKPGVHKVKLKYKQAISNVEYKLDPSEVTVVISPKESKTENINTEVVNLSKLDSKLSIESMKLNKEEVIIKGSKDTLDKVVNVKALVNINEMQEQKVGENKINEVPLVAYDENGEIINVEIVPKSVKATVTIASPSKIVPIKLIPTGSVVFGKAIESLTSNVEEVTIYGSTKSLEKITSLPVKVDVSDLKTNKQVTKSLKKPNGIREISVKTINVDVKLGDEVTTEISGVKLGYTNLDPAFTVQATDSSSTEITVILKGVKSVVDNVTAASIEAYVDLKNLTEGEHKVDVDVKGSDNRVNYEPKVTTATIQIARK